MKNGWNAQEHSAEMEINTWNTVIASEPMITIPNYNLSLIDVFIIFENGSTRCTCFD